MTFLAVRRAGLALAALFLAAIPAAAQSAKGDTPDPLRFGTDAANISFAPFVQFDGGFASASPDDLLGEGDFKTGDIRRARLYVDFTYHDFGGRLTVDAKTFEESPVAYAYLNYAFTDALTVQVGQQDLPFAFQDLTGSRAATFNEDGQNATLQTSDAVGAAAIYGGETFSLSGGVFGADINERPFDDGTTLAARASYAPIAGGDTNLHLGLGLVTRFDMTDPLSFSGDTGSSLVSASTISSGDFEAAERYSAANLELAATAGRFTLQSEYTLGDVKDALRGSAVLHGGYAAALVFLTDDTRGYDASAGSFEKVKPASPITAGGGGALEIGARLDYLDLTDAGPDAGAQVSGTGILNWYFTEQLRISASHAYTHVSAGPDEGADYNASILRAAFIY